MTNIVLMQLILYLLVSPVVIYSFGSQNSYRFDISIIFIVSFVVGLVLAGRKMLRNNFCKNTPYISSPMKMALIFLGCLYIYAVLSNDMFFRRNGSEVMAAVFSGMPLEHLIVIRIYEILFYPVIIIGVYSLRFDRSKSLKLLLVSFLITFLFTGVADSRAKIILPAIYFYVFFIASNLEWQPISKKVLFLGLILSVVGVLFVANLRMEDVSEKSDFILKDYASRMDGLEFISSLSEAGFTSYIGTLDLGVFSNVAALLPFLDTAKDLKLAGLTSSKSYLLQEIMGRTQFDINNSVVTDLYYFGGYFLIMIGAIFYGYQVKNFDRILRVGGVWKSRASMALTMSFLVHALRVESDYFGMFINISRDFFIYYFIFLGVRLNRCAEKN